MLLTMDLLLIYSRYQIPPKPLLNDVEFPFCPKRTKESLIMDSVASQQISKNFFSSFHSIIFQFSFPVSEAKYRRWKKEGENWEKFSRPFKKVSQYSLRCPKKVLKNASFIKSSSHLPKLVMGCTKPSILATLCHNTIFCPKIQVDVKLSKMWIWILEPKIDYFGPGEIPNILNFQLKKGQKWELKF